MNVNVKLVQALLKKGNFFSRGRNSLFLLVIHFHSPLQIFMSIGQNIKSTVCETALRVSREKSQQKSAERN